ncbi:MAG: cytochrome o ubiquinol oxidase subunit III [Hyphomicrobiaceae bacterium]
MAALGNPHSHAIHVERSLGFWFYLMSDAVLFAVLFANYAVQLHGTADGPKPYEIFELRNAAIETGLLLVSSLTFGLLSLNALSGLKDRAMLWLGVTFVLGAGFLFLEYREFSGLIAQGAGPQKSGFLSAFFALVGTHGLHVTTGLVMLIVLAVQMSTKGLTEPVLSRLYRVGLFWHFLDIIWVGVFSFVYLPGVLK